MPDREGPKAVLAGGSRCEKSVFTDSNEWRCGITNTYCQNAVPADCPKMGEDQQPTPDVAVFAGGKLVVGAIDLGDGEETEISWTPDEAEALATALLIAARKARKT